MSTGLLFSYQNNDFDKWSTTKMSVNSYAATVLRHQTMFIIDPSDQTYPTIMERKEIQKFE